MSFLELSSDIGLIATVLLTLNILLGMMLGTAYKRHTYWKKLPAYIKRISVATLHNWVAYVALLLVLLHAVFLLFDADTKFRLIDIVFPIHAPHQALFVAVGTLAMYALFTVIITTQRAIRKQLSFRTWKNIHLISYGTAILFVVHGVVLDPQLKDRPVDFFDAEKVLSELCGVALIAATVLRYQYYVRVRKVKSKSFL